MLEDCAFLKNPLPMLVGKKPAPWVVRVKATHKPIKIQFQKALQSYFRVFVPSIGASSEPANREWPFHDFSMYIWRHVGIDYAFTPAHRCAHSCKNDCMHACMLAPTNRLDAHLPGNCTHLQQFIATITSN